MSVFDDEHNRRALLALHNQGIEMTMEELVDTRRKALENIRRGMRAKGYDVPDDDTELFLLVYETIKQRR